ncbi:MAG: hypothetical protein JWM38_1539 [Sphingomonas bacterium]|nr:hypothetical protein [Sphingomonas bacterium]
MTDPDEHMLRTRQPDGLYGVGRALRSTFTAENHETLGTDITRLLLELSQEPATDALRPRVLPNENRGPSGRR